MAARPGLNKEVIGQAAAELADRVGLEHLTLAVIAQHLGVRTPSLYNHVAGVDGLREVLSLLGIKELDRRLQRAALGKSHHAALAAMLQAYRAFAKARPGLYEATLRSPAADDGEVQRAAQDVIETILTVLEPYALTPDEAIHVVRGFRAIGHGFATLEAAGGFGIPLAVDESYQRLIAAFLRGLDAPADALRRARGGGLDEAAE